MGYNGPPPEGSKPDPGKPSPPAPWGDGPIGKSRVYPSDTRMGVYLHEYVGVDRGDPIRPGGRQPEPGRGFLSGLFLGWAFGSDAGDR